VVKGTQLQDHWPEHVVVGQECKMRWFVHSPWSNFVYPRNPNALTLHHSGADSRQLYIAEDLCSSLVLAHSIIRQIQ
jgi:hypothetical protein